MKTNGLVVIALHGRYAWSTIYKVFVQKRNIQLAFDLRVT